MTAPHTAVAYFNLTTQTYAHNTAGSFGAALRYSFTVGSSLSHVTADSARVLLPSGRLSRFELRVVTITYDDNGNSSFTFRGETVRR